MDEDCKALLELVSRNFVKAREERGITQQELADRIGVNRETVSKYESGKVDIPFSKLVAIQKALDVQLIREGQATPKPVKIPVEVSVEECEKAVERAEELIAKVREAAELAREITSMSAEFRVYVKVPDYINLPPRMVKA